MVRIRAGHQKRTAGKIRLLTLLVAMLATAAADAQFLAANNRDSSRPPPRLADGTINLSGPPGEIGNWEGNAGAVLFTNDRKGAIDNAALYLPSNLSINEIPWQDWSRAVYDERQSSLTKDDPHTRCKPSGGPRMFHTPYGFEILQLQDSQEIMFLQVGAPHSWRTVFMDGRAHPANPKPTWFGHSVGHWEDDTLVVDTVGFNDKFWLTREGVPHTTQLHIVERFTRSNFDNLVYQVTIDDPGAYTAPWSGGWYINWVAGNEPFDYLCQENNRDAEHMIGQQG
jgi:hypothetical protein